MLIRGIQLYTELCNATVASEIFDDFPGSENPTPVKVRLQTIHDYLGTTPTGEEIISTKEIVSILEQLECKVVVESDFLTVRPPTFRPDLTIPADIIEEIARIYGYHKLPSVIMDTQIPTKPQLGVNFSIENRIKRFLVSIGLQEIYSYSMVSEQIALQTDNLENHLKLQNPLTDDKIYLRKSLLPSLNEILDQNSHVSELSVFEIANVYLPRKNDLPAETLQLSIVSTKSYREVRGILESLLAQFFVKDVTITQNSDTTGTISVAYKGKSILLGIVQILANNRIAIELEFAKLLQVIKTHPTYHPIPKTAIVTEDLTFTLPKKIRVGEIMKLIAESSSLITNIELKGIYNQNYSFTITYHDPKNNLASDNLKPVRKKIVQELEKQQGILVGTV